MLGKNDCIGIAPDGITDPVATCRDAPEPLPQDPRPPRPACVIVPDKSGEQPIAGDAAFECLDGRGWDPRHSRSRAPVLPLLLTLEGGQGVVPSDAGNWLAAHVRALSPAPTARHIIAVPDRLGELGQQRLLDALRRANIPVELLWRPIATVLGWACGLSDADIQELNGQFVLVVHLGFWAPEMSRLELKVEAVAGYGGRWLVPIRNGRGYGLPTERGWPIEQAARRMLAADLARIGLSQDVVDSALVWLTRRPWAALCGESPSPEMIRDRAGCWRRCHGPLVPSDQIAAMLGEPVQAMLDELDKQSQPVDRILLDGPLTGLDLGPLTLGDQLAEQLRKRKNSASTMVEVLPLRPSVTACGAAHYGWRQRYGIPGYYDTVPALCINALKELRPAFISLLPGQQRVAGGKRIGPVEVAGFAIGAGTESLDYYLTRSDERTVRLTQTKLPEPPATTTPVKLVVTQTPGQGFASVEICPLSPVSLGARAVFLDWGSMSDTGKTPEQILQELSDGRLAYPDPIPFRCHAAVWKACGVAPVMVAFIENLRWGLMEGSSLTDANGVAEKCRQTISAKPSLDYLLKSIPGGGDKAGVFDSDGNMPSEISLCEFVGPPPFPYTDYRTLIDDFRDKCGIAFAKNSKSLSRGNDMHRHLLLIAGWCYANAPSQVLDYVRQALRTGNTLFKNYDFNVAGRCFSEPGDIRLLFRKVRKDFEQQGIGKPFDRARALSLVLAYRPDAPFAIDLHDAFVLAGKAVDILEQEQRAVETKQKKKLARTFFAAVFLLTGLLRCRRVDAAFLESAKPETKKLVTRVRDILGRAVNTSPGGVLDQLEDLREEIPAFLEAKGTDALIFKPLDELSDKHS